MLIKICECENMSQKKMEKYNYALIGNFVMNSLIIDSYIWGSASFLYFAQPLEWTRVLVLSHWSITIEPSVQVSPRKDPRYKLCSYYIQIIIHLKYREKVDTVHFLYMPLDLKNGSKVFFQLFFSWEIPFSCKRRGVILFPLVNLQTPQPKDFWPQESGINGSTMCCVTSG